MFYFSMCLSMLWISEGQKKQGHGSGPLLQRAISIKTDIQVRLRLTNIFMDNPAGYLHLKYLCCTFGAGSLFCTCHHPRRGEIISIIW